MTDNWQERAKAAEDGLFRVVKALGFDTDGAPNADEFFGPMTYCTEDARYTTPADIAVAYATDYRAEMGEETDSIQFALDLERVHGKKYVESERDRYRAAIEDALKACPSLFHPDPARKVDQVIGILARALKENT